MPTIRISLAVLALLLVSCGSDEATTEVTDAAPTETTSAAEAPTSSSAPTTTVAEASGPQRPEPPTVERLVVTGGEEIVFDWTTDRCEDEHIPDIAARAFRDVNGDVQLNIGHYVNYRMIGPSLDQVVTDCSAPTLVSDFDPDPAQFNDSEWLGAFYTEDGQTIYAVVHNEYRGVTHQGARPGQCPSNDNLTCLDTSFTMAVSVDAGATFTDLGDPPNHLVATLPYVFDDEGVPSGIRQPSNIVRGPDGFFYVLGNVSDYPERPGDFEPQWMCVLRTDDLADPSSWRYWDGNSFAGVFVDPYVATDVTGDTCAPVGRSQLAGGLTDGLVYSETLERFIAVGISWASGESDDPAVGNPQWGVYYSLSPDLINWGQRRLLLEIESGLAVADPANELVHAYPAIIDPDSSSSSFDTIGETAYLYISRFHFGGNSLDRDLIRFPIAVESGPLPPPAWEFDTDGDYEGWIAEAGLNPFLVEGGALAMTSTDTDPFFSIGGIEVPAYYDGLVITMSVEGSDNTQGQVFFTTSAAPDRSEAMSVLFDVIADGQPRDYVVDFASLATWSDTITGLRIDPTASSGAVIEIDRIAVFRSTG